MKTKLVILSILFFCSTVFAQDFKRSVILRTETFNSELVGSRPEVDYGIWRVSKDKFQECADCTFGHATASYIIASELSNRWPWWKADLVALSIGIIWEVKDGYVPWEKAGLFGGEGFSKWDIVADVTGILVHRLRDIFWEHKYKHIHTLEKLKAN